MGVYSFGRSALVTAFALAGAACGGSAESDVPVRVQEPPIAGQRLSLYTHCGIWSVVVDGRLWLAAPPLHDGSGNPPDGWDSNTTRGTWSETGKGRAVFRADSGKLARFVAARPGQEDANRGCE